MMGVVNMFLNYYTYRAGPVKHRPASHPDHQQEATVTIERMLRVIAGIMILISVLLTHYVSPWWLILTAFIGLNLLQSGFTNWCPMISLLRALGLRSEGDAPERQG